MSELTSIPSRRTDHDVHVAQEQTLVEMLAELRHLRAALARSSESRSSVEIKTSTRGYDVTTKVYDGSPTDGLVDQAIAMYGEAFRRVQSESMNGWADTVAAGKPAGWTT